MPVDTQAFMTAWKGKPIDGTIPQSSKLLPGLIFGSVTQRSSNKLGTVPQFA